MKINHHEVMIWTEMKINSLCKWITLLGCTHVWKASGVPGVIYLDQKMRLSYVELYTPVWQPLVTRGYLHLKELKLNEINNFVPWLHCSHFKSSTVMWLVAGYHTKQWRNRIFLSLQKNLLDSDRKFYWIMLV